MFTLWLMAKGQGALVGATYGLLLRAETEKKNHRRKRNKDRVRERDPMTDRALKLPRLSFSLSLSPGRCSPCAFFFFFLFARTQKKPNAMKKKKKKRARSQRTGSSRSTDCVRPDTTSLKKKKKRTALGKKKKGTLRRLRDERGGIGLSVFTRGPLKSHDLKDLTPRPTLPTHTHTQITPSPHPAG